MKAIIYFSYVVLIILSVSSSFAQTESEPESNSNDSAAFCITLDVLPAFTGAIVPGLEGRIDNNFTIIGSVGFGKILFTDIKSMYSIGARYYPSAKFIEGLFVGLQWSRIALSTNIESADVKNIGFEFGYRWQLIEVISIDLLGGLYTNNQPKTEFKEVSGNLTKTITLGGGPSGGINVKLVILM